MRRYKKWREKEIFYNKHMALSATYNKSLMIDFYHKSKDYVDDETREYAKTLSIIIGGYYFRIFYSKNFRDSSPTFEDKSSRYYGMYSIDGEIWWHDIWWHKKLYSNPLAPTKFLGCYIYDFNKKQLFNKKKYEITFTSDLDTTAEPEQVPYFMTLINTPYINKNNETQKIPCMRWLVEERRWTLPILHWLHLDRLYIHKIVDFEYECEGGHSNFNGFGVIQNDWKGGRYGGSIILNNYPEIYKIYNEISVKKQYKNFEKLVLSLNKLINKFMHEDKTC